MLATTQINFNLLKFDDTKWSKYLKIEAVCADSRRVQLL